MHEEETGDVNFSSLTTGVNLVLPHVIHSISSSSHHLKCPSTSLILQEATPQNTFRSSSFWCARNIVLCYIKNHYLSNILFIMIVISSVQSLSHVRLFATPWTTARQASLSITNSWSPPKPCPLSQWCHPTNSSSVVPFSSCPQSFPASGSFPMSQLFASGGQSIGVSASTSVLPVNTQDWSPLGWTLLNINNF